MLLIRTVKHIVVVLRVLEQLFLEKKKSAISSVSTLLMRSSDLAKNLAYFPSKNKLSLR
jgi:hypothetical protein